MQEDFSQQHASEESTGEQSTSADIPQSAADGEAPQTPSERRRVEIGVVMGDLFVVGGGAAFSVHAPGEPDPEATTDLGGVLRFATLPDHAELHVPTGYEVAVATVSGDVRASDLDGALYLEFVEGDAVIDGVASLACGGIHGDLRARDGIELSVARISGDARIEQYSLPPVLGTVSGDLTLRDVTGIELRDSVGGTVVLERAGAVLLRGHISGDVRASSLEGPLQASHIDGDLHVADASSLTIGMVRGDLSVERLGGALAGASVDGDVRLRAVIGPVRFGRVSGDLSAVDVTESLSAGEVAGDVTIECSFQHPASYTVVANGDIRLRARGEISARFVAQTSGGEIRTSLPLSVERGRRRNLVGVLGRGTATVTLQSRGGDITITGTDERERMQNMSDDQFNSSNGSETTEQTASENTRTWEGGFGGRRFRLHVDRGPGRAGVRFEGPFGGEEDPNGPRDFGFSWGGGRGPRTYGEYEARFNDLREKAEQVARRAAEQASRAAEQAAQRVRETDWESMGREIRVNIEQAMEDLEGSFTKMRREWETRRPSSNPSASRPQRVRIEHDDLPDGEEANSAGNTYASQDERDARRRQVLEQLRTGEITLDDAERQLNDLR